MCDTTCTGALYLVVNDNVAVVVATAAAAAMLEVGVGIVVATVVVRNQLPLLCNQLRGKLFLMINAKRGDQVGGGEEPIGRAGG